MPEWDLNMSTAYKGNRRWVLNRLWLLIYNSPIAIYNLQEGKKEKEKELNEEKKKISITYLWILMNINENKNHQKQENSLETL